MAARKLVHIGIAPRVIALDPATGGVVWATELPNAGVVATIRVEGERVYAGSAGEVSCLDAATGRVLWHNPLKGYGVNPVLFAGESGGAAAGVAAADAGSAAGASGAMG